ncbi:MAG: hypothetical protein NWE84_05855 [Candidatus Bathyarchaeota archaeon]|nr:hypothetical protein [Candidatus Bathyarchaeota archaeon]
MKKAISICLLLLLIVVSFGSIMTTQGVPGEGEWITSYSVVDSSTGQLKVEVDFETEENRTLGSIFPGSEIAVTFTVDVSATSPSTILKLKTTMLHSTIEDVYWKLITQDYELIAYNPNEQEVRFYQVKDMLTMTLYGRVPQTVAKDKPVQYLVVTLYSPAGEILDNIKVRVVTAEISEYDTVLLEKEEDLQSLKDSGISAGYIELYENVLNESRVQADLGNVESAIAMLNTLSVRNAPPSSTVEGMFLPVVGVLVVVAALFGFMFVRGRGKIQYVMMVLEDQIRDLEGLTLRASKVDRTISTSLESVKDRLKSVVGM